MAQDMRRRRCPFEARPTSVGPGESQTRCSFKPGNPWDKPAVMNPTPFSQGLVVAKDRTSVRPAYETLSGRMAFRLQWVTPSSRTSEARRNIGSRNAAQQPVALPCLPDTASRGFELCVSPYRHCPGAAVGARPAHLSIGLPEEQRRQLRTPGDSSLRMQNGSGTSVHHVERVFQWVLRCSGQARGNVGHPA